MSTGNCSGGGCGNCQCEQPNTPTAEIGGIGASYRFALIRRASLPIGFGVAVDSCVADGPAATAGILPNDIIFAVNNEPVEASGADLVERVVGKIQGPVGTTLDITVERDVENKVSTIHFTLVRASISASAQRALSVLPGQPKCKACPFADQEHRCVDCPNPVRAARARAKAAAQAAQQTQLELPPFVLDIIQRSQAMPSQDGAPDRAVSYINARQQFHSARRAVEEAQAYLEGATDEEREVALEELSEAQGAFATATAAYESASEALQRV